MHDILDVFSPEILELVIRECRKCDPEHFRDLRLVSKVINGLVEPLFFSTVTFRFMKRTKPSHVPELLNHIISGASPYVLWAKELRIISLVPAAADEESKEEPWRGRNREISSQKEDLIPAIRSLLRVERVECVLYHLFSYNMTYRVATRRSLLRFTVGNGELCHSISCAIAELPLLRDLELAFLHFFEPGDTNADVPFARFSELHSITLHSIVPTPGNVDGLKRLIANSPSMRQLTIKIYPLNGNLAPWLDHGPLLEGAVAPVAAPGKHVTGNGTPTSLAIKDLNLSEVQLLVIGELDVLDLIHLQQTCKSFHTLTERSVTVWRRCLIRQSLQNVVFWPTYKDLSTSAEFKHACLKSLRFMRVYENALAKGQSIPTTKTELKFPPGILRDDIADSYLVSGGRFLFTFEPTWLSLWDLQATDEEGRPTHLLRKHIMEYDAIIYIGTVELNKIRIIIEARSLAPVGATASVALSPQEEIQMYEVHEVAYHPTSSTFSAETLGHLPIICPRGSQTLHHAIENKSVFHIRGTTLVWDVLRNEVAGWAMRPLDSIGIGSLFANQGFILYIHPDGIQGVEALPLHPFEGGYVYLSSFSSTYVDSCFSLFHKTNESKSQSQSDGSSTTGGMGDSYGTVMGIWGPDTFDLITEQTKTVVYALQKVGNVQAEDLPPTPAANVANPGTNAIINTTTNTTNTNTTNTTTATTSSAHHTTTTSPNVFEIQRYQLTLTPSNPLKSSLTHIETWVKPSSVLPRTPPVGYHLVPNSHQLCGGSGGGGERMATMWSEERRTGEEERTGAVYVSVVGLGASTGSTRTPTPAFTPTSALAPGPAKKTEIKLVQLQLRDSEEAGTGMLCISGDLCPVSGRAAIHWETEEGRSNVTVFDV
ncbi:hypothetical protein H1R20_g2977, partial [Candolleomyces eurysporus]